MLLTPPRPCRQRPRRRRRGKRLRRAPSLRYCTNFNDVTGFSVLSLLLPLLMHYVARGALLFFFSSLSAAVRHHARKICMRRHMARDAVEFMRKRQISAERSVLRARQRSKIAAARSRFAAARAARYGAVRGGRRYAASAREAAE